MTRAVYGGKEEVWRTADKLGNLYESEAQTDRRYTGSQLQHDGKWWYYYDNEGNLILKSPYQRHGKNPDTSWQSGSWAYKWNANGSLKSVKRADGKEFSFKYDAFGRRISKSYGSREFLYIWDKNVPLHEIKKEGKREDEITTWVFQGFIPTAKIQGDKSYSIISDHIGTPLQAIDTQGNKVWERTLDIYGKVRKETEETANFVPFLFQGQYLDTETELVYNYKRYYSQETGAYISQDPIGLAGGNPTIYGYVKDPNSWIDVFGLNNTTQSHHIISDKNNLTKNHALISLAGYKDPNDFLQSSTNKIDLPTKYNTEDNVSSIHSGKHYNIYSELIADAMDEKVLLGKKENWTQDQYKQALDDITNKVRDKLNKGEIALNKNRRKNSSCKFSI